MSARAIVSFLVMFAAAAVLGAGFALFGPVALIRIFGAIAFVGGAAGCAVQLYAMRHFAPRAYSLLHRKLLRGLDSAGTMPSAQRTVLAGYR